jgi:hypothetical protein
MALLRWLTRRCFVCRRLCMAHSVAERARCENTPLPIQLVTEGEAVA